MALRQDAGLWTALAAPGHTRHGVCNWLIPADSAEQFCAA
jgi:hypothetical protein